MTTAISTIPVRSDTLPENTNYSDDGCELSTSCLSCPLPMCKYDDPGWLNRASKRERSEKICRLRADGVPAHEIAKRIGVSSRTVHRTLKRGPEPYAREDEGPQLTLQELAHRSLFRARDPLPPILKGLPRAS